MLWKYTAILMMSLLVISSCKKDDDDEPQLSHEEQLALDIEIIEEYLADEGLTAQKTASGLHYIILEEGDGRHPTLMDTVEVKYKGYFNDKTVFDQTGPAQTLKLKLDLFIDGWREGIPYLESGGGKGTLLIPSYLGYGSRGSGAVPPNSVLIFDITLIDFE